MLKQPDNIKSNLRRQRDEKLIPGTHYEVNADAAKPFLLAEECQERDEYAVFPAMAAMPELQRFRTQWILPHKGILDKERRATLFFLYRRPWVLLECHATAHVPHIANLDLVILRHQHDLLYPQVTLRRRLSYRDTVGPRLAPEWTKDHIVRLGQFTPKATWSVTVRLKRFRTSLS